MLPCTIRNGRPIFPLVRRRIDILRAAWYGDYDDPNTFLDLGRSDNGNNHSGWIHSEYDELIALAARTPEASQRMQLFQQAEAILLEEMPYIPLYFYVTTD